MTTAVFPGSFDPITKGHEDIALRASKLFDRLIVSIGENVEKKTMFSLRQRVKLLEDVFKDNSNIEIMSYSGLTVDFCRKNNVKYIVRGLRTANDYTLESQMESINRMLYPEIETIFFMTDIRFSSISSSVVRELIKNDAEVQQFIPKNINIKKI